MKHIKPIFDRRPASDPLGRLRGRVKILKFNCFRTCSCCISNKRESRMHSQGRKYLPGDYTTPNLELRSIGQNSTVQNMAMFHIN